MGNRILSKCWRKSILESSPWAEWKLFRKSKFRHTHKIEKCNLRVRWWPSKVSCPDCSDVFCQFENYLFYYCAKNYPKSKCAMKLFVLQHMEKKNLLLNRRINLTSLFFFITRSFLKNLKTTCMIKDITYQVTLF